MATRAMSVWARMLPKPTYTGGGPASPDTLQRRFLRQSDLRADTTIPWWQNRRLRFQFT